LNKIINKFDNIKNEFNLINENFNNLIIKSESYVENIKEKEYDQHCLVQKINNSLQNCNNVIELNVVYHNLIYY